MPQWFHCSFPTAIHPYHPILRKASQIRERRILSDRSMSLRITSSKSNQRRQLMSGHRGSSADYVTRRRFLHKPAGTLVFAATGNGYVLGQDKSTGTSEQGGGWLPR